MKNLVLSLVAIASISSVAMAERSYDLSDCERNQRFCEAVIGNKAGATVAKPASGPALHGHYGASGDAMEIRRWDEKNGN